jgi:hypothetical protein
MPTYQDKLTSRRRSFLCSLPLSQTTKSHARKDKFDRFVLEHNKKKMNEEEQTMKILGNHTGCIQCKIVKKQR